MADVFASNAPPTGREWGPKTQGRVALFAICEARYCFVLIRLKNEHPGRVLSFRRTGYAGTLKALDEGAGVSWLPPVSGPGTWRVCSSPQLNASDPPSFVAVQRCLQIAMVAGAPLRRARKFRRLATSNGRQRVVIDLALPTEQGVRVRKQGGRRPPTCRWRVVCTGPHPAYRGSIRAYSPTLWSRKCAFRERRYRAGR